MKDTYGNKVKIAKKDREFLTETSGAIIKYRYAGGGEVFATIDGMYLSAADCDEAAKLFTKLAKLLRKDAGEDLADL